MERKKRSWREWVVWIALVAGLYPLSFGPAFWIAARLPHPPRAFAVLGTIYRPAIVAAIECPRLVQQPIAGYLNLGAPRNATVLFFDGDSRGLLSEHPGYTYTWLSYGNPWPPVERWR